ncbi:hypothetical protein BX616_004120, partial [Lobosporangium transversale]
MLDDILDNASSETLSHGLETGLHSHSRIGGVTSTSSFLTSPSAAVSRARLNSNTTLGFLLPQPKGHFSKLKAGRLDPLPSGTTVDQDLLQKLEEQNSLLPPQDSTSFLLARLERQNGLLDTDPKSVCIESNVLKGNLNTLHKLIADSTATLNSPNSETVDPMSSGSKIMEHQEGDEEIDWEFWGMLVQDYNAVASKLPHLLAARVRQGLPSKLRGLIWQSMSQASSTYLETMYTQLLKEHSPYERIIQRDLARTFPQIDMFKEEGGKGQEMLGNILKAYSLYDPHVGYCQGLGFLVGPLLMNMDEKEAFCVFVRLMETYDMRTMFTLNMEGLQLRLYQFSALLSEHLPMLHAHLSFHSIHAAMYASQWFLSLFAYTYPLQLVLRIYDVVFSEGAPETIMRVAVAFLKKNEERLMQLQEFEDLLEVLSTKLYDVYEDNAGSVIKDAMALSSEISKDKLDALAMAYLAELEDQQKRAGEVTSKRFRDRFGASKAAAAVAAAAAAAAPKKSPSPSPSPPSPTQKAKRGASRLSIAASFGSSVSLTFDDDDSTGGSNARSGNGGNSGNNSPKEAMLHEQIQDLAKALSTLQRDHAEVTEAVVTAKMEKMQYLEEIENLRRQLIQLERQQNRASMMSAISPSIMSQSDTASTMMTSSPRTTVHESDNEDDKERRASSSWSTHSHEDENEDETETKASSVASLNAIAVADVSVQAQNADLTKRLKAAERELAHVTSELVHSKVLVMEAMNEVEAQRLKTQSIEKILMDSREAVVMLQDQQIVLQDSKMAMAMELDNVRHERDTFERDMNVMRQQFEETKKLWLEGQVERQSLQEKIKELEMSAAFAAANPGLSRNRSVRKSLNEAAMYSMMNPRSGSSSPRAMSFYETIPKSPGLGDREGYFRVSGDSQRDGSSSPRTLTRRESSDTLDSTHSGRESLSSPRPAALVRKGWPSEKAASAGVVPTTPTNSNGFGTRKFMVAAEGDPAHKLKRSQSTRSTSMFSLGFRR